jgi:hypothetical protein
MVLNYRDGAEPLRECVPASAGNRLTTGARCTKRLTSLSTVSKTARAGARPPLIPRTRGHGQSKPAHIVPAHDDCRPGALQYRQPILFLLSCADVHQKGVPAAVSPAPRAASLLVAVHLMRISKDFGKRAITVRAESTLRNFHS